MELRQYQSADCNEMAELFYNTIHTINARDYSKAQLDAWATGNVDLVKWDKSFSENFTVVAVETGIIVGFGDLNKEGYIDRLFVHKDYQTMGIASAILSALEKHAIANDLALLFTQASITAKPFFEANGYFVVKEQKVERKNQLLTNFIMEKHFK